MRQFVYQICYTRYHVSFYLWWIGPVLKLEKFQNIMTRIAGPKSHFEIPFLRMCYEKNYLHQSLPAFTCSKSTTETSKQYVKSVQSQQSCHQQNDVDFGQVNAVWVGVNLINYIDSLITLFFLLFPFTLLILYLFPF